MKIGFILLPLAMLAGAALADEVMPPAPAEAPAVQATASPSPAESAKPKRRHGADMRHCLDLKDDKAIIRCAEPGRKP